MPVSFICDKNSVYFDLVPSAYEELRKINPLSAPYLGLCTMGSDEDCILLQMADLIASEIKRCGLDFLRNEELSPALELLMSHERIWSLKHMNGNVLNIVRELVDKRASADPRRKGGIRRS